MTVNTGGTLPVATSIGTVVVMAGAGDNAQFVTPAQNTAGILVLEISAGMRSAGSGVAVFSLGDVGVPVATHGPSVASTVPVRVPAGKELRVRNDGSTAPMCAYIKFVMGG